MLTVKSWKTRLYAPEKFKNPMVFYFEALNEHISKQSIVLDIGAGAGLRNRYDFRGRCKEMLGVDFDPRVTGNPLLDRGFVTDASGKIPLADESCDVAFSIYVLEHVEDPESFVKEVRRVLRPGGVFLSLTPNRYHYVPIIATLTPHWFHQWFNKKRGIEEDDTFPTYYRMNTRGALLRQFSRGGFEPLLLNTVEDQPNYLTFCTPAFLCGVAYERIVSYVSWLAAIRVNIICAFRKK